MPTTVETEVLRAAATLAGLYGKILKDNHPSAIVRKDGKVIAVTIISEPLEKLSEAVQNMLRQPDPPA